MMCGHCWLNHGDPFTCRCRGKGHRMHCGRRVWEDPIDAIKDAQAKANHWKRPYAIVVRAGAYQVLPLSDRLGETIEVVFPTTPRLRPSIAGLS